MRSFSKKGFAVFDWIRIDSPGGNRLIAAEGLIFAITALALFAYYIISVGDAASLTDRALQAALLFVVIVGAGLVSAARTNLLRLRR